MLVQKIEHIQLAMPAGEENKARKFYGEFLGISEVPKPAILAKKGGAWFESGDIKIHLGADTNFVPSAKAHIAFLTQELDQIISRGRAEGMVIFSDEGLHGYERVYIYDPFGNRLEFMQATGG